MDRRKDGWMACRTEVWIDEGRVGWMDDGKKKRRKDEQIEKRKIGLMDGFDPVPSCRRSPL